MVGQKLGHYQIVGQLGAGGMGVVYRARDERLDREVAIKVVPPELLDNETARARFHQEARTLSRLSHPNIASVFEFGSDQGVEYLVMELVSGMSLRKKLASGALAAKELLPLGAQMAQGLAAAHEGGIVHRDLKPENLMVTPQGHLKILDFGLAKLTPAAESKSAMDTASYVTAAGAVPGTLPYLAPEQLRGEPVDARLDIYAAGTVLYEMATGRPAFEERGALLVEAILNREPPPVSAVNPRLPSALNDIVSKAMDKNPDRRYQSARELAIDLERVGASITRPIPTSAGLQMRRRSTILLPLAAMALLIAGIWLGTHRYPPPASTLTDKDTIVLADFTNTTGDAVFDGTLRQGLAIQLEQSPFLSLVSEERIQKTLHLMGQSADARLTPELAREICERTASAAVLDGSIASLGSQYVLGLRAKNCRTGDVLDEEQVQAPKKEDVLNALSQIASKFRTRVGESLATVEKHSTPLAEATTPSLEALKAYSAAAKILLSGVNLGAAVPLFKRAIEIDPKFAMAHASLGFTYGLIGEPALSAESSSKAYELRDRAADAERFFIAANYDLQVTGNLEKAQQTCETWAQTYPREITPYGLLGSVVYPTLGKYEKAVEAAKKQIELDPDFSIGYYQLSFNDGYLGRLEESENALNRASKRKLDIPEFLVQRYDLAFLKGDTAGMERETALAHGMPGAEDMVAGREGFVLAYSGHLQEARKVSRHAAELAQQAGEHERAALFEAGAALREAFFGNAAEAKQVATSALALSKDRDVEYGVAFALALSGDSSRSQALTNDLEKRFPEDSSVRFSYVPAVRALLALNHNPKAGDASRAIELLQVTAPYDLGTPLCSAPPGYFGIFYPVYVRGMAYLAAHRGAEAAVEFQKILDHRTIVVSDPIGALAHMQLGRAFAMSGDRAKARTAYQNFFTLWKDADPDIPILKQAKAEYARLQ